MIYLYNLMLENDKITICNSAIAQFSVHKSSMSIGYGKAPLSTGYWLAKVWFLEKSLQNNDTSEDFLSKLSAYIIIGGLFIFFINLINFKIKYSLNMIIEISKIIMKCSNKKILFKTFMKFPFTIINRFKRDKKFYTPN